jgi:hypothetical protein
MTDGAAFTSTGRVLSSDYQSTGSSELAVDDGSHTLIASAIWGRRVDDEQQYGWVSRKEAQLLKSTECEIKPVPDSRRCCDM